MKKRILAAFLALVMVISGIYFTKPEAEEVKAATTQANTEVPTEMLGVKMQPRVNDNGTPNDKSDDTMDLRVLSSVDSLDYKEVGFYVWYDSAAKNPTESNRTTRFKTTTVFKRIGATSKVAYKFSPKMIDTCAEYFVTGTIMGIKYDNWGKDFYIQAYCVTNDGQTVTGVGRYFNVATATLKEIINIPIAMPAEEVLVGDTTTVTVGGKPTDANVEAYIDGYAHLNVQVADKTKLPSATVIEHVIIPEGTDVEYLETGNKAIYRNVESELKVTTEDGVVTVTGDTSWYKAYEGETEFVIANIADLYGFAQADTNFAGKTIYMIADIDANDGKGTATANGFTRSDGKTPYPWRPIGQNFTNAERNFAGTFDGEGHTISGLYASYTGTYTGGHGLFGTTGLCTIRDFNLANTYFKLEAITNTNSMAGVAGISDGIFDTILLEEDVYIVHGHGSKEDYTGGIVGTMTGNTAEGSKISNCQFSGTIIANDYVGGILATATDGTSASNTAVSHKKAVEIEHCLNNGQIILNRTGNAIGGICGAINLSQLKVTDSVNTAQIDLNGYTVNSLTTGSFVGWFRNNYLGQAATTDGTENTYAAIFERSYAISGGNWKSLGYKAGNGHTKIDGTAYPGSGALKNTSVNLSVADLTGVTGYLKTVLDFTVSDYEGHWSTTANGTPVLTSFADVKTTLALDEVKTARTIWYKASDASYTLYSFADMLGLVSMATTDFSSKTIKLGADITMNKGTASATGFEPEVAGTQLVEWTPLNVAGVFDGQGHTISGLYLDTNVGNAGLFATVSGTVKDLRLLNSYINCTDAAPSDYTKTEFLKATGSIAGSLSGTIDSVYSDAFVNHKYAYAGGLVGTVYGTGTNLITNSCFAGKIKARNAVGGLVGLIVDTNATISHSLNAGEVTTTDLLSGGLCGYVRETATTRNYTLTITDCLNVGKLSQDSKAKTWAGAGIGRLVNTTATVSSTYWHYDSGNALKSWEAFSNLNGNASMNLTDKGTSENTNTYHLRSTQGLLDSAGMNLSFLPEGQASSATDNYYWVAREGKIPMLESFEDLLTNLEF